jgi:hypothetical protein
MALESSLALVGWFGVILWVNLGFTLQGLVAAGEGHGGGVEGEHGREV